MIAARVAARPLEGVPADPTRGIDRWMQAGFQGFAIAENWRGGIAPKMVFGAVFATRHQGGSHAHSHRASVVASHPGSRESEHSPKRGAGAPVFLPAVPGSSGSSGPPVD